MEITSSIVLYSSCLPDIENKTYKVLRDCILYLDNQSLISKIILIDNSPYAFYKILEKISSKIKYIYTNKNIGYGRGHNLAKRYTNSSKYHIIVNPDIIFSNKDVISNLYKYMEENNNVAMVQPLIRYPNGNIQYLCKRNPTFFAQFIRSFYPSIFMKIFKSYNSWYEMRSIAYKNKPVESFYLSGCFMFCRVTILNKVNWFCDQYFMYLEDADLTRSLARYGKCVHLPFIYIQHNWTKGSHKSLKLRLIAIISFFIYSFRWGFKFF